MKNPQDYRKRSSTSLNVKIVVNVRVVESLGLVKKRKRQILEQVRSSPFTLVELRERVRKYHGSEGLEDG